MQTLQNAKSAKEILTEMLDKFLNQEVSVAIPSGEDFQSWTGWLRGYTVTDYGEIQYVLLEANERDGEKISRIVSGHAIVSIRMGGED